MTRKSVQEILDGESCLSCLIEGGVGDVIEIGSLYLINYAPLNSFITLAGITDATQIAAVTGLYSSAILHGWWSKCDLIYPFVGGTALAHSINLKSPGRFTITWHGTVTHNANGITGNGSTGYGDTGYDASTSSILSVNSTHASVYARVLGNNSFLCGAVNSTAQFGIRKFLASLRGYLHDNSPVIYGTESVGMFAVARLDGANKHAYQATDVALADASIAVQSLNLFILAYNNNNTPGQFSSSNLAGLTLGSGLTFAEYQVMASDWQTFQTALGRAV